MEFSQYVKDAIKSVDYVDKDRDFHAVSLLRGAAENAENETDSHILSIIVGSMTMSYQSKEHSFAPLYIEYGVGRSFAPEDLDEADLDVLRHVAQLTQSTCLRTRFAHIIWSITKEYPFGQLAVTGYLDKFQKTFHPEHWVRCHDNIEAAYHIASSMGKSADAFKQTRSTLLEVDSDAFRKHMVRHVAECRRMSDSIPVRMAFQHVRKFGTVSEDALDFLVKDNAIIPENRAEIIRDGLSLALNGKLYMAMHILQPQTENIFRHLVKMCGDTVTFLQKDGTEEYRPLSSLFKSEKLLECYDEDVIFTFQSIMDEPVGENLRNLNGHGLLDPVKGNGTGALCFVSLLILLLSIYGNHARDIRMRLAKME